MFAIAALAGGLSNQKFDMGWFPIIMGTINLKRRFSR
jgi:hypothetical protein